MNWKRLWKSIGLGIVVTSLIVGFFTILITGMYYATHGYPHAVAAIVVFVFFTLFTMAFYFAKDTG